VAVACVEAGLFSSDDCSYTVYLDNKPIFAASNLSKAFIGVVALYYVFGVHYPRSLTKTCTFLSSHVAGFKEPQLTSVQTLYNKLAA